MSAPRVSIGLPFLNPGPLLADALRSVFAQTFPDWELVLVDDGSTDCSTTIAQSVRDPRVTLHRHSTNRGLPYCLNSIPSLCRGEYIARFDADDLMHPLRLERQVAFLDAHPEVDVVGCGMWTLDTRDRLTGVRGCEPVDLRFPALLRRKLLLCHPTILARRSWFLRNPYDDAFGRSADVELWCRTLSTSSFANLAGPFYFYRVGRISVLGYFAACGDNHRIYKRYGPRAVGTPKMYYLIGLNYLKGVSYAAASALGLKDTLMSLLSHRLDASAKAEAEAVMEAIRSTPVPGFSDAELIPKRDESSFPSTYAHSPRNTASLQAQAR
ncbi:MAG TPA: glycosyltransferase family A protein [Gemmataceae bacterium]|jgi:glycosyltransferase involved in cell wall biosynthesis